MHSFCTVLFPEHSNFLRNVVSISGGNVGSSFLKQLRTKIRVNLVHPVQKSVSIISFLHSDYIVGRCTEVIKTSSIKGSLGQQSPVILQSWIIKIKNHVFYENSRTTWPLGKHNNFFFIKPILKFAVYVLKFIWHYSVLSNWGKRVL